MKQSVALFKSTYITFLSLCLIACGGGGASTSSDNKGEASGILSAPLLTSSVENSRINLSWSNSFADEYRVFYWRGNDAPQEQLVVERTLTTAVLSSGTYTVIVEAYDDLGHSLFSRPETVEVP